MVVLSSDLAQSVEVAQSIDCPDRVRESRKHSETNPTSYYSTLLQAFALGRVGAQDIGLVTPLPLPAPPCCLAAGSPCCGEHPDPTALMATETQGLSWTRVRTQPGENTELEGSTSSRIQPYG